MTEPAKPIAVVQGAPSAIIQAMFAGLAHDWQASLRLAGVIEEGHGPDFKGGGAGRLRNLRDGAIWPMFEKRPPGATGCGLIPASPIEAGEALKADIHAGCDLAIISKFGRLESERSGLVPAFVAAIECQIPVLTSVSPYYTDHWQRFADPLFVILPPERAAIIDWLARQACA